MTCLEEEVEQRVSVCEQKIIGAKQYCDMKANDIPYAEQVLEYSLDVLQDQMSLSKVVSYDN